MYFNALAFYFLRYPCSPHSVLPLRSSHPSVLSCDTCLVELGILSRWLIAGLWRKLLGVFPV